jgi:hypothetical protein
MMNKKTSLLVLCLLAAAASIAPAFAEELGQVKVTIPFAFRAGNVNLPAGDYTIVEENAGGLFLIEGRSGSAMFVTAPGDSQGTSVTLKPELKFQKTGQSAVLTEIRLADAPSHLLPLIHGAR